MRHTDTEDDFDLKDPYSIHDMPEELYYELLEEYSIEELESYLSRDIEARGMDIEDFIRQERADDYGWTDEDTGLLDD